MPPEAELVRLRDALDRARTNQETLEAQVRILQKTDLLGRLAFGLVHEISTPLQFVQSSLDALAGGLSERGTPGDDLRRRSSESRAALRRAMLGLERCASVVRAMRQLAHPGEANKRVIDLNEVVESALLVSRSRYKRVATLRTCLGELPPVRCHPEEIGQVVVNLVVNAAQALSEAQARSGQGKIRVGTSVEGALVVVQVEDNGTGVEERVQRRMFEPFFTTKPPGGGTGQGLSIARHIVEARHGGRIEVASEVGSGTTVCFKIPVAG